jgi:hypothetical protein
MEITTEKTVEKDATYRGRDGVAARPSHALPDPGAGLIVVWVGLASGFVERSASTALGLVADVTEETRVCVTAGIDCVEAIARGGTRLLRRVSERLAELSTDALARVDRGAQSIVRGSAMTPAARA